MRDLQIVLVWIFPSRGIDPSHARSVVKSLNTRMRCQGMWITR